MKFNKERLLEFSFILSLTIMSVISREINVNVYFLIIGTLIIFWYFKNSLKLFFLNILNIISKNLNLQKTYFYQTIIL